VGALASSFATLVIVRVILGIGTSAAYPSAMNVLRMHSRRIGQPTPRTVLGVLSLAALSSAAIGPTLGGFLTGAAGWRAVFAVNVPIALIGIVLCLPFVEADAPGESGAPGAPLDVSPLTIGAVGFVFGVAQGTNSVANQAAVYAQAPASEVGTAAGLQRTAGYLGAVGSSGLLGFFYAKHASTPGLHSLALVMLLLSAVVCAITLLDPSLKTPKKPEATH